MSDSSKQEVSSPTSDEKVEIPVSSDPEEAKAIEEMLKDIKDFKIETPTETEEKPEDKKNKLKKMLMLK